MTQGSRLKIFFQVLRNVNSVILARKSRGISYTSSSTKTSKDARNSRDHLREHPRRIARITPEMCNALKQIRDSSEDAVLEKISRWTSLWRIFEHAHHHRRPASVADWFVVERWRIPRKDFQMPLKIPGLSTKNRHRPTTARHRLVGRAKVEGFYGRCCLLLRRVSWGASSENPRRWLAGWVRLPLLLLLLKKRRRKGKPPAAARPWAGGLGGAPAASLPLTPAQPARVPKPRRFVARNCPVYANHPPHWCLNHPAPTLLICMSVLWRVRLPSVFFFSCLNACPVSTLEWRTGCRFQFYFFTQFWFVFNEIKKETDSSAVCG